MSIMSITGSIGIISMMPRTSSARLRLFPSPSDVTRTVIVLSPILPL